MKKLFFGFSTALIAMLLFSAVGQGDSSSTERERTRGAKDECLLVAINCPSPDYRLQERINRLRDEIDRGTAVYTPQELSILRRKLEDARAAQDFFNHEGPSMPY